MVGKGNLAVFEGSSISETKEVTPTKINACTLILVGVAILVLEIPLLSKTAMVIKKFN